MKIEIKMGIPRTMVSDDIELEKIKQGVFDEYVDRFANIGVTKDDIEITLVKTDGEFYTKISGAVDEDSGKVPMSPKSTKTIDEGEPVNLKEVLDRDEQGKSFDNSDITEDQEKACSEDDDIVYCDDKCEGVLARELDRFGENVALLKLYLMLSNNDGWEELHTRYGSTHIDDLEKRFLLEKLFVNTGLDSIAKDIESVLDKHR